MRSIFVGMPSYHNEDILKRAFDVIYQAAEDENNFVIYLSRDDKMPINSFSLPDNVQLKMVPSEGGSLKNIFLDQLRSFQKSECSIFVTLPDDLTFAPDKWDSKMIAALKELPDTNFAMRSNSLLRGRIKQIYKQCYVLDALEPLIPAECVKSLSKRHFPQWNLKKDSPERDFVIVYHTSEMFPVFGKMFSKYVEKAFVHPDHHVCIEMVTAAIVQQLYKHHHINRYICYSEDGFDCTDQRSIDSRSKRWPVNMRYIKQLADEMAQEIKCNAIQ